MSSVSAPSVGMVEATVAACVHSRFNARRSRDPHAVLRLAQRMARIGFEPTRALWAIRAGAQYEVFAGGTRLEAARQAGLATVPIVVHEALTDDDIARLSDQDNENDEYHMPVSAPDVWAEYARLRDQEGWTQQRIAAAKGVDKGTVSRRIAWHFLPDSVKRHVGTGGLTEGHLKEIVEGVGTFQLLPWLEDATAVVELADKVIRDGGPQGNSGKNGSKSVAATRTDVAAWREWIAYAQQVWGSLSDASTLHDWSGAEPVARPWDARAAFVEELAKRGARSLVAVKAAERAVRERIAKDAEAMRVYAESKSADAAKAAEQSKREAALLARFHHGDCRKALASVEMPPIRLLLTDPPYGSAYQSNRRWRSKAPERIAGDGGDEAMGLISDAVLAAMPLLADEAHVLVFCDWRHEPDVRALLEDAGLVVKVCLVWVKEEHSAGDVRGAFAPRHERIVHAVKGSPEVTPRIPDVLEFSRSRETQHPTEKPVALLRALIRSTTAEGALVADPFAGCASTLVAAMAEGREFWGAEVDGGFHDAVRQS